jgi:hypothetical protein
LTPELAEIRYFVLLDRVTPFLLAQVRWPDVAQAISSSSPEWLEDTGLFDLPYDASAVEVSFDQAAALAAGWGRALHAEPDRSAATYIRRMPANWSDLTPSERRAWGIEFTGPPRTRAATVGRIRPQLDRVRPRLTKLASALSPVDYGLRALDTGVPQGIAAMERRGPERFRIDGRAYIRAEQSTLSAALVDISESGLRCSLPEALAAVSPGRILAGPYLIEAEAVGARICLDVTGRVSWEQETESGTQFGLGFGELPGDAIQGMQHLLADVSRRAIRA